MPLHRFSLKPVFGFICKFWYDVNFLAFINKLEMFLISRAFFGPFQLFKPLKKFLVLTEFVCPVCDHITKKLLHECTILQLKLSYNLLI